MRSESDNEIPGMMRLSTLDEISRQVQLSKETLRRMARKGTKGLVKVSGSWRVNPKTFSEGLMTSKFVAGLDSAAARLFAMKGGLPSGCDAWAVATTIGGHAGLVAKGGSISDEAVEKWLEKVQGGEDGANGLLLGAFLKGAAVAGALVVVVAPEDVL